MKKRWIALLGFVAGVVLTIGVPLIILALGVIDFGADVKPGPIESTIAPWARDQSVERRAPKEKGPYDGQPAAIAVGFDHYRHNCVMCHGAPGVQGAELSRGLNPPAPSLGTNEDDTPDGQLFWVIKHGIRMTPMPAFGPTHTDEQIWKIVAFVRHLPHLTAQERQSLQAATSEGAHHPESSTNAAPANPGKNSSSPRPSTG